MQILFLVAVITPIALLVLNRAGVVGTTRRRTRDRRDFFGDFRPVPAPALDTLGADADLYLRPRHGVSDAAAADPPAAPARHGGTIVALPSRGTFATSRSVAQR